MLWLWSYGSDMTKKGWRLVVHFFSLFSKHGLFTKYSNHCCALRRKLTLRASKYSRQFQIKKSRKIPRNQTNKRTCIYIDREGRSVGLPAVSASCRHQVHSEAETESPSHYVTRRSHATSVAESPARPKNKSDRRGRAARSQKDLRERHERERARGRERRGRKQG